MKDSIKRAQSRAGSSFAERENFRPKVKQLKRFLLTLVALLAVTTGAWADGPWTSGDCTVTLSGGTLTVSGTGNGEMYPYNDVDDKAPWVSSASSITSLVIEDGVTYIGDYAFYNLSALTSVTFGKDVAFIAIHAFDKCTSLTEFTFPASVKNINSNVLNDCTNLTEVTILATDLSSMTYAPFYGCGNLKTINIYAEMPCGITNTTFSGIEKLEHIYVPAGSVDAYKTAWPDVASYIAAMPAQGTPVPLTWDAATPNTATLTNGMPAGNVTVSVEYFPQAEFAKSTDATLAPTAIADVPANTDAPIVKAGTVANIGTSEVPQGTLMYFVSQPTGNTVPDAPDYDDDGWSDKVPTANGLAQGKAFVWYYIKGAEPAQGTARTDDNTRSDSDIKPLGTNGYVTLAAEPTYYVSLNKTGMADGEPAKWSAKSTNVTTAVNLGEADLEGVKKGETVTVTYSGTKKVLGVKAEKKAKAATGHALSASVVGEIVGSDGKAYAADDKDNLPEGVTAVAIIAYVGSATGEESPYTHGLAIAMKDADAPAGGKVMWSSSSNDESLTNFESASQAVTTAQSGRSNSTTSGFDNESNYPAFYAALHNTITVSDGISAAAPASVTSGWFLPSLYQWNKIVQGLSGQSADLSRASNDNYKAFSLNTKIEAAGGDGLQSSCYWSSTEYGDGNAWFFIANYGIVEIDYMGNSNYVRACLAF